MTDVSNQGFGQTSPDRDADALKADVHAAREKIGEAVQTVRAEAASFAESAAEKATDQIEEGKAAATSAVEDFAQAIRKASEELGERDQTFAARLVGQAAEGLETLSRTVSEKRPEELLDAVRAFGRDNPTAFLAGAVLAGVAIGRFAKSSAHHDGLRPGDQGSGMGGRTSTQESGQPPWNAQETAPFDPTGAESMGDAQPAVADGPSMPGAVNSPLQGN